ncbi:hypothetical protein D7Z54_02470 [Salibacterium salarium]|uniref:Uncharacterized protein n=1 Tax=Salibacterium salarium TaxID=284579 RepID=A0A428N8J9_9BACI|nr:hypothetical protein [Salibacterium salarium]RSL34724.1 hypothetical protein D7Z54_02470 [Salibacterium salarium]
MKTLGITLLMFGLLTGLSFGLNIGMGDKMNTALRNVLNPFQVMELIEVFILTFFILMFFVETIFLFIKKRKKRHQKN